MKKMSETRMTEYVRFFFYFEYEICRFDNALNNNNTIYQFKRRCVKKMSCGWVWPRVAWVGSELTRVSQRII